jgi:hypothetical protein
MLTERLGLPRSLQALWVHLTERWDGKGEPGHLQRNEVPLALQIAHVARDATFSTCSAARSLLRAYCRRTCKPQRQMSSSRGARALCVRCLPTLLILLESSDLGVLSWSADRSPAAEPPRRLASPARSPQPNATRTQTPRSARRQSPTHRDRVRSHTHLQAPARPQSHPRAGRPDAQREQRPRVVLGSFRFPQRVSRTPTNATPARR